MFFVLRSRTKLELGCNFWDIFAFSSLKAVSENLVCTLRASGVFLVKALTSLNARSETSDHFDSVVSYFFQRIT